MNPWEGLRQTFEYGRLTFSLFVLLSAIFFFFILPVPLLPSSPVIFSYTIFPVIFISLLLSTLLCFFFPVAHYIGVPILCLLMINRYIREYRTESLGIKFQVCTDYQQPFLHLVSPGWRRFLLCCHSFQTTSCRFCAISCCSVSRKHLMGWNLNNKIWLCCCSSSLLSSAGLYL